MLAVCAKTTQDHLTHVTHSLASMPTHCLRQTSAPGTVSSYAEVWSKVSQKQQQQSVAQQE